ncbi:MAG: hypothetical protein EHM28_04555 [Spirochaetaceae bacterium]|nr:MAG: hypothetical protein EHM28_04555 [Spirochaetaceae bacterium]
MGWILMSLPMLGTVLLIIHVVKTGRDRSWIYIVLFIPVAGALAYFFIEVLPSLLQTRQGRQVKKSVMNAVTSSGRIRRLQNELAISDTFEKKQALADAYLGIERYAEAIPVYRECLAGIFSDNLDVRFNLAICLFQTEQFVEAEKILASLDETPGRLKIAAIRLMHARTLEAMGKMEEAGILYAKVAPDYPGFEGYARHAIFLKTLGKQEEALAVWKNIKDMSATLPAHNRRVERQWISRARQELRAVL